MILITIIHYDYHKRKVIIIIKWF